MREFSRVTRTSIFLCILTALAAPALAEILRAPVQWSGYVYSGWYHRGGYIYGRQYGNPQWRFATNPEYCGALRFDISALPADTVFAAQICCYQGVSGPNPNWVTCALGRFEGLTDQQMWVSVRGGSQMSDVETLSLGWARRMLNAEGIRQIGSHRALGWFQTGIVGGTSEYCWVYGSSAPESLRPYLRIWYGDLPDLAVRSARVGSWPLAVDGNETLVVVLESEGRAASSANVLWLTGRSGTSPWSDTAQLPSIPGGEGLVVQKQVRPSTVGMFSFAACIGADSFELNHANDSVRYDSCAWVFPRGTYAAESFDRSHQFPPPGWAVANADSGQSCWSLLATAPTHTPPHRVYCPVEQGPLQNDDWLISEPLYPAAGYSDSAGFYYCSDITWLDTLQVWALGGPSPCDTICRLGGLRLSSTTWRPAVFPLDDLDGREVRLGVRLVGQVGCGVSVDDFWFSRLREYGVEEKPAEAPLGRVELSPNPTRGRVNVAGRELGRWRLMDVAGRVVAEGYGAGGDIDLSRQRPGVYSLEFRSVNRLEVLKLVKAE